MYLCCRGSPHSPDYRGYGPADDPFLTILPIEGTSTAMVLKSSYPCAARLSDISTECCCRYHGGTTKNDLLMPIFFFAIFRIFNLSYIINTFTDLKNINIMRL